MFINLIKNVFKKESKYKDTNKIPTEVVKELLKNKNINNFDKLENEDKIILKAIVWEYKTNLNKSSNIPDKLKLDKLTSKHLEKFKEDFNETPKNRLHGGAHNQYMMWMKYIGLDYETDRSLVQRIIDAIYNYTDGEMDYRNFRMKKQIRFKKSNKKED